MTPAAQGGAEALRASRNLQLISTDQEGVPLHRLPAGVYGFTFTPASPESPMFRKAAFLSFELQKTADDAFLLGYVTAAEAAAIEEAGGYVDLDVYPEPRGESTVLVSIAHGAISSHKPLERLQANKLRLTVHG